MGITPHSLNHTAHYLSKLQPGQCLPRIEPPHPVLVFSTLNEARRNRLFHVVKRIGHWSSLTIPGQGNVRKGGTLVFPHRPLAGETSARVGLLMAPPSQV